MATTETQSNEEPKIWEKPWSLEQIKTNSTTWSLAGDAGLLLNLKQFSENLLSKTIALEKEIQQLSYQEKLCNVKFQNSMSNFLILENSQFMENRVYEEDATQINANDQKEQPQEKTKEEKEQELLKNMNESLKLGMSIMDNYFEKLDANSSQDDLDEDEDEEENENKEKNKDIVIYEAKDPYVLRSLPYLIGSQLYMENDHVGLKDLDSEDEADSEEEIEEDDEEKEKSESDESSDSEQNEDDKEDSDDFTRIQSQMSESKKTSANVVKKQPKTDLFDSLGEEDDDDDDEDIFSSKKTTKTNIFDEPDEESNKSDNEKDVENDKNTKKEIEKEDDSESEQSSKPAAPPPVLDFAAELSKKLSQKFTKKPQNDADETEQSQVKSKLSSNLSNQDENDDLFSSKQTKISVSKVKQKSLFDDSDDDEKDGEDDDLFKPRSNSKSNKIDTKPTVTVNNNKKSNLFSDEESETSPIQPPPQPPAPPSSAIKKEFKKVSIFDDDDEDDDNGSFLFKKETIKAPPVVASSVTKPLPETSIAKPKSKSLFDDDDEEGSSESNQDLFSIVAKKQPVPAKTEQTAKKSLFDSLSEDDLLSEKTSNTVKKVAEPAIQKKSLFDSLSEDDILSDSDNKKKTETLPKIKPDVKQQKPETAKKSLFDSLSEDDLLSDPLNKKPVAETVKKQAEPSNKKSLFDSLSEDDNPLSSGKKQVDVANVPPPPVSTNKPSEQIKKSLFDSSPSEDDLLGPGIVKKEEIPKKDNKKSLFDSPSDDEDLFVSKKTSSKVAEIKVESNDNTIKNLSKETLVKEEIKPPAPVPVKIPEPVKKSLFDSDEDENEIFQTVKKDTKANVDTKPVVQQSTLDVKKIDEVSTKTNKIENEIEDEKPVTKTTLKRNQNLLFDPSALKSSALFKKVANDAGQKEESSEKSDLSNDLSKLKLEDNNKVDDLAKDFFDEIADLSTSSKILSKASEDNKQTLNISSTNDDFFSQDIQVDRTFTDSSLKNIQKDRIKASGGRKKAPTIKRNEKPNFEDSDIFSDKTVESNEIVEVKQEPASKPKMSLMDELKTKTITLNKPKEEEKPKENVIVENVKPKEKEKLQIEPEKKKVDSIFDSDPSMDDIFSVQKKPSKQQNKVIDSIFDDEDIFSDSLLNKPKESSKPAAKAITSVKSNETQPKQEAKKSNTIDKNDDDFDLFKVDTTKKVKKPIPKDYDPLNFFDD